MCMMDVTIMIITLMLVIFLLTVRNTTSTRIQNSEDKSLGSRPKLTPYCVRHCLESCISTTTRRHNNKLNKQDRHCHKYDFVQLHVDIRVTEIMSTYVSCRHTCNRNHVDIRVTNLNNTACILSIV